MSGAVYFTVRRREFLIKYIAKGQVDRTVREVFLLLNMGPGRIVQDYIVKAGRGGVGVAGASLVVDHVRVLTL